jgi:RNA polymerase sigma-70 factor, ECF subfamily
MQETDEILIKKIAAGDERAFEEIVARHQNKIINMIYRNINSFSDAQELAQDIFVKVWNRAKTFRGESKFSTWLYRITINAVINHTKKKKPLVEIKKDIISPAGLQPDSIMSGNNRSELIKSAVDSLPITQKTAFILSKHENHSYEEISDIMGISISAVESLLFRAKKNLKEFLMPFREKGEL